MAEKNGFMEKILDRLDSGLEKKSKEKKCCGCDCKK
jgi:hypothetical protein